MSQTTRMLGCCLAAALIGCGDGAIDSRSSSITAPGGERIWAMGASSCDFDIDLTKLTEPLGAVIERDRIFLQRKIREETGPDTPGMLQKHIPFTPVSPTAGFAGGRYLFEGRHQAAVYADLVKRRYTYLDTQFLSRPEFANAECRDLTVLSAWRFVPLSEHTAMRTERFDTGRTSSQEALLAVRLAQLAPSIIAEAGARGYAEVHVEHNAIDHKVQLVYFVPRILPQSPDLPDVAALGRIAGDPPLGESLASELGITRVFDRSSLVLHLWKPYAEGDHGAPALWPNSPPAPAPFCGDGVCVPSQGEDGTSCAADCVATCGDAECQPGETLHTCPSDCELPFIE